MSVMKFEYAVRLVHQYGCSALWPRAGEIAQRMVDHNECVAHAAYVVMQWPTCSCSPCRRRACTDHDDDDRSGCNRGV